MNHAALSVADVADAPALSQSPQLLTVRGTAQRLEPAISETTIRDWIYHAEPRINARGETIKANGFAVCLIRIGGKHGKLLIDWARFIEWIEDQRVKGVETA